MPMLDTLLSKNNSRLDYKRLEKLITLYATRLTPPRIPAGQVGALVEEELRQRHQEGMTAKQLKAHLDVKTMKEVRKKLRDKLKKQLLCQVFLNQLLLNSLPSPTQVTHFYQIHIAPQTPEVPLKVVLVQLAFYPTEGTESIEEPLEHLSDLYETLSHIKNPKKRTQAFLQTLQQYILSSPYPLTYGYFFNAERIPQLTLAQVPQDIQKSLLATGATKFTTGMISPPHTFIDENGVQGVRIIFLKECIPPHRLNLADDYPYITQLWLQVHREANLKAWWDLHKKETEIYEL